MIVIGLTGSIGMGKTTTADLFRQAGLPVFDADATVHALYDGPLAAEIEAAFPGTTTGGRVDRARLADRLSSDNDAFRRLEAIVHPAVRRAEAEFLERARAGRAAAVVLDIPLLLETGRQDDVDKLVVVSAPAEMQRARVLARPGMTAEKLEALLARQMSDAEKRARADVVIPTGAGIATAKAAVDAFLRQLLS
ncbi:dephospho-CoA kinase [Pleomorphomonas diazotrophica]|uniref:Dephospho-CoA kinase n=1 Tax=Pleomorphomonas diazotrophica TaxID=1166257 RepID=A0A1I4SWS6_9HYPH|nr:dephospho-CoA kinase [Pleomorphomonas diazotrophica]PKR88596.1 dephospho-CoA kinase [Pleomorphomonas diazotrophica]SFM68978.1 dephospho-CoA kinase [Pleomorphomonas diazotrophica]